MTSTAATLVIVVRDAFLENGPNTYPIINTIETAKSRRVAIRIPNIILNFMVN
jgi:hypothetical protein